MYCFAKIYDDQDVKMLERKLLDRGLWAFCEWVNEMPPPFDDDKQCTKSELEFLLENTSEL
jgi:hypothetical protein